MTKNPLMKARIIVQVVALLAAALVLGLAGCDNPAGDTSYTVKFDSQGGSAVPDQSVKSGGTVAEPGPVSKADHTLAGWHLSLTEDAAAWDFANDTVTADITLYARWSPDQCVASFDAGGGTPELPAQSVKNGAKLTKPPDPVKTGHTLAGWHLSLTGDAWDFAKDTVTANITLHAKWQPRQYTVTFNSNGGGAVDRQTVAYGDKVAEPEPPVNGSLILEGWYTESALTSKWDFAADTAQGALTLYARWVEVPPGSYLVSFNSQGGGAAESQIVAENGVVADPNPPPERTNFAFDTVAENTTIYAKWQFIPVTDIVNVPADGIIGEAINLGAATVAPANASYKTIVWSASGAGLTAASVEPFSPTATGTLTLTATIVNAAAAGNYTKNFTIPITTIRPVTAIDGIASGTYSAGTTIDLNTARATPVNATNKTIGWRIKTAGAGVYALGVDKTFTLTAGGTLVLTATIANGREDSPGVLSDYTEDFTLFVDKIVVPGEVGLGEDASIKLYANGGSDPLPTDVTIRVDRDTEYYVNVDPVAGYGNIEWRLNGTVSTVTGGSSIWTRRSPGP